MLRIREANPFPDAAAAANDELFEQITALRRAGRSRYRRPLVVFAVLFAAVAVLASTAFGISQWIGGDVVKPDVTKAEYLQAQHELTLPPGYSWPELRVDPNSVTTRGGGGGYAVAIAQNRWECYWVAAIRRGDTAEQARARASVETLLRNNVVVAPAGASENWSPPVTPGHPVATFADDGGYEWKQQTYALAVAGHPQRLVQSCRANR
jgi:hypothetical protein